MAAPSLSLPWLVWTGEWNSSKTVVISQGTKVNKIAIITLQKQLEPVLPADRQWHTLKNALEHARPPLYEYLEAA